MSDLIEKMQAAYEHNYADDMVSVARVMLARMRQDMPVTLDRDEKIAGDVMVHLWLDAFAQEHGLSNHDTP